MVPSDAAERVRTFVALYPSPAQRDALEPLLAALASTPAFRATPVEQVHLTLAFLGDVPRGRLDDVVARTGAAAARHAPFALAYGGLGAFPERGAPRVVWLGVEAGREALLALAADVRDELAAAGLPVDGRPFRPHLTLARARPRGRGGGPAAALRGRAAAGVGGAAPVREVAIVTSRLGAGGATHARHAVRALGGDVRDREG